jgi:hypothetical protein
MHALHFVQEPRPAVRRFSHSHVLVTAVVFQNEVYFLSCCPNRKIISTLCQNIFGIVEIIPTVQSTAEAGIQAEEIESKAAYVHFHHV